MKWIKKWIKEIIIMSIIVLIITLSIILGVYDNIEFEKCLNEQPSENEIKKLLNNNDLTIIRKEKKGIELHYICKDNNSKYEIIYTFEYKFWWGYEWKFDTYRTI